MPAQHDDDTIRNLIQSAEARLERAETYDTKTRPELTCEDAQQAAELALKALIKARRGVYKRTHEIEHLLETLEELGEIVPAAVESVNSEGPKPDPQKVLGETEDAAAPDPWTPNRGLEAPSAPGDICGAVLERPSAASLPDNDRLRGRARRVTDKRRESWTPTTTAVVDRTDTSIVVELSRRLRS